MISRVDHSGQYAAFGRFERTPEPHAQSHLHRGRRRAGRHHDSDRAAETGFLGRVAVEPGSLDVLSPIVAPAVKSGALRTEHHEPSFKCQMTIVMDKPFETKYSSLTDGREVAATERGAGSSPACVGTATRWWPPGESRVRTVR